MLLEKTVEFREGGLHGAVVFSLDFGQSLGEKVFHFKVLVGGLGISGFDAAGECG